MRTMKRISLLAGLLAGCLVMSACQKPVVPPADYDDAPETTDVTTEPPAATSRVTSQTTSAGTDETDASGETDAETTTEAPTTAIKDGPPSVSWAAAYETLLNYKDVRSMHENAYYALLQFDPDNIPELIVLDDIKMELYHIADGKAELLMEDAYKSAAVTDQNVCYQPLIAKLASGFSTMGGGAGYYIFEYQKLDTTHVTRLCFDNNEDEGGEMPYNPIWDKAEEYGVQNNGWHDVTLGEPWVVIDEEFDALRELKSDDAETLLADWKHQLGEDDEEDPEEDD